MKCMQISLLQQKTEQRSTDGTIQVLSDIIKQHSPDVLIGAEFLFVAPMKKGWDWDKKETIYTSRIFNEQEKISLDTELSKLTEHNDTLLIPGTIVWAEKNQYRNSCPVFNQGKKIKEIYKEFTNSSDSNHTPDGVLRDNFSTLMLTSPINHSTYIGRHSFPFKEKNYLIEICDDHLSQARRREISDAPPQKVDVQIIISNSIHEHFRTPRSALFARESGYIIECNGYYPTAFVGRISGNEVNTIYWSPQPAIDKVRIIDIK